MIMIGVYIGRLTDVVLADINNPNLISLQHIEGDVEKLIVVATTELTVDHLLIIEEHYKTVPKALLVAEEGAAMYQNVLAPYENWEIKTQPVLYIQSILALAEV